MFRCGYSTCEREATHEITAQGFGAPVCPDHARQAARQGLQVRNLPRADANRPGNEQRYDGSVSPDG